MKPQLGPSAAETGPPEEEARGRSEQALAREVDRIVRLVERMNLGDYIGLLQRPGRLLWINFLAGLARGLGTILGATLLVSLIVAIAQRIIATHLPGVSGFVQHVVRLLEQAPPRKP